jgi:dihydrofolate reductase
MNRSDACCRAAQPSFSADRRITPSVSAAALPLAERLYLTRVLAHVDGDIHLPELDMQQWQLLESELQEADEQNDHACRFEIHQRCSR